MSISKEMNYEELSDLEEGEILEYDTMTHTESTVESHGNGNGSNGYVNKRLKEKLKLGENIGEKPITCIADLESISSEEEYKTDLDVYLVGETDYYGCNSSRKKRKEHSSQCYGTVEDIMSEIGETICRKSRCNNKKWKSKDQKKSVNISFDSSYDLWCRKIFSSHLKSKSQKRKSCACYCESDLTKTRVEKRKKRKRRDYNEEEEKGTKKLKLRDFDEMRLSLLEKLKKQKEEEILKASTNPPLEPENSEIQEVDMLIDCTNYVDDPPETVPDNSTEVKEDFPEREGEDDLDLVQLRLIALASNKRRKETSPDMSKTEDPESAEKKSEESKEEVDLDRNELLLRAEALKTALLKKYQRRLNRLKVEKPIEVESFDENTGGSLSPATEECEKDLNLECGSEKLESDACKENLKEVSESGAASSAEVPPTYNFQLDMDMTKGNEVTVVTNANSKKIYSKGKVKRKKRKPVLSTIILKENNEKTETLEEDDRTLRTQLLSDLMKKKCLKDQEKKSVLIDSSQTTVNKPSPPVVNIEPPKENLKPLSTVKKCLLKKVNVPRTTKPVAVPKFPKPDIQRIIVHLGSEDSSDDDVVSPKSSQPQDQTPQENELKNKGNVETNKQLDEVIQASYERSVELLLSQARKKIEGEKRTAANTLATPEAVYKHLPPSQRLEYIRLKQKIAERERQRNHKRENPSNTSVSSGTRRPDENPSQKSKEGNVAQSDAKVQNLPKSDVVRISTTNSGFAGGTKGKESSNRLVVDKVKTNFPGIQGKNLSKSMPRPENGLKSAGNSEKSLLLLPSSQALISKLKLLLRKIKMEKVIEENYEREMSKLRNQLSLMEKKKCMQGLKIKKLWEESMKTYKAIQGITGKSNEKVSPVEKEKMVDEKGEKTKHEEEKVKESEGKTKSEEKKVEEKEKEKQEEGKNVSHEPESELCKAQSKTDKDDNADGKLSETISGGTSGGPCLLKYDSPLQVFNKVSEGSERVDPNVMMCQFDLMGVCKDEDCAYQHLRILAK